MLPIKNVIRKMLSVIAIAAIFIMEALVFYNTMLRYVFNSGFYPTEEIAIIAFIWVIFLGAVIVYFDKEHLAVDVFINKVKNKKVRKVLDIISTLCTFIAFIALFISILQYTKLAITSKTRATGINYSIYTIPFLIMIVIFLICFFNDLFLKFKTKNNTKRDKE